MSRTATSEIKLSFQSTIRNTLTNNDTASATVAGTVLTGKIDDGIAADEANRAWRTTSRTISANTNLDIDLYDFAGLDIGAGAGLDALGQELILEEIVTLILKHASGTGRLEIMPSAPAGALAWAPSLTVANGGALKAGGVLMLHQSDTDAFDVADGVSHVLRLRANGAAVTFDLYLLGRNDDEESSSSTSSSSSSSESSSSSTSSLSSSSASSLSSSSTTT